jgi:putative transposase
MYFCTFTCYNWLHLFEQTKSYDLVYNWFNILKRQEIEVIGFIIMPNHVHCILYFPESGFNLNKILSNGKRFMAYKIVNRLYSANDTDTLNVFTKCTYRKRKKEKTIT